MQYGSRNNKNFHLILAFVHFKKLLRVRDTLNRQGRGLSASFLFTQLT